MSINSTFKNYSKFYNLLYKDKDYDSEVDYIHKLISQNTKLKKSILDLGCGTGIHAEMLYDKGYEIIGVDISNEMLDVAVESAKNKKKKLNIYVLILLI